MKAKKTFLSFLILFVFVFHAVNVSAYTLIANDGKTVINVQGITKDQFPEIVTPLEFESQEEADAFLKEAFAFENDAEPLPEQFDAWNIWRCFSEIALWHSHILQMAQ